MNDSQGPQRRWLEAERSERRAWGSSSSSVSISFSPMISALQPHFSAPG